MVRILIVDDIEMEQHKMKVAAGLTRVIHLPTLELAVMGPPPPTSKWKQVQTVPVQNAQEQQTRIGVKAPTHQKWCHGTNKAPFFLF